LRDKPAKPEGKSLRDKPAKPEGKSLKDKPAKPEGKSLKDTMEREGTVGSRSSQVPPPPPPPHARRTITSLSEPASPPRASEANHKRINTSLSDAGGSRSSKQHNRKPSTDDYSSASSVPGTRTDSAIAVQSELQRAFISLSKSLYHRVYSVMKEETPKWLKQCCQDNYFSLGTYRQTKILIAEELCFNASENINNVQSPSSHSLPFGQRSAASDGDSVRSRGSLAGGSTGTNSAVSRGSDR
jgi:hypothetical protein